MWKYGSVEVWKCRNLEMCKLVFSLLVFMLQGSLEVWKCGDLEIFKLVFTWLKFISTWLSGGVVVWKCGNLETCKWVYMQISQSSAILDFELLANMRLGTLSDRSSSLSLYYKPNLYLWAILSYVRWSWTDYFQQRKATRGNNFTFHSCLG